MALRSKQELNADEAFVRDGAQASRRGGRYLRNEQRCPQSVGLMKEAAVETGLWCVYQEARGEARGKVRA